MNDRDGSAVARPPAPWSRSGTPPTNRRVTSTTGAESRPNASTLNAAMIGW
jgi:hypothetical protein